MLATLIIVDIFSILWDKISQIINRGTIVLLVLFLLFAFIVEGHSGFLRYILRKRIY